MISIFPGFLAFAELVYIQEGFRTVTIQCTLIFLPRDFLACPVGQLKDLSFGSVCSIPLTPRSILRQVFVEFLVETSSSQPSSQAGACPC